MAKRASMEERLAWLREWPVGTQCVVRYTERRSVEGMVVGQELSRGWPVLMVEEVKTGNTYYVPYGIRGELSKPGVQPEAA
jgi:hypothetical protein